MIHRRRLRRLRIRSWDLVHGFAPVAIFFRPLRGHGKFARSMAWLAAVNCSPQPYKHRLSCGFWFFEGVDGVKLSADYLVPSVDDLVPSVQDFFPSITNLKLSMDYFVPSVDDLVPSVHDLILSITNLKLSADYFVPSVDYSVPSVHDCVPSVHDSALSVPD